MRQVGKSTLLRDLLGLTNLVTLDDEEVRADAESASKLFLSKYPRPFLIDEVQKVPKLFDAIKSEVDRNRIPGLFYLSGSQRFSHGELTQESLTGRIATIRLYPLTLLEAYPDETLNLQHFVHGMHSFLPRLAKSNEILACDGEHLFTQSNRLPSLWDWKGSLVIE